MTNARFTSFERDVLASLAADLTGTLGELLEGVRSVAILDYPFHLNCGDSMIFLGELRVLADLGIKVREISHLGSYDGHLHQSMPRDTVMLFHGGGNFGDLYPVYQKFRLRALVELRDFRCVVLPQSLHFSDAGKIEESRSILEDHPDLTLTWRDRTSLELAQRFFPESRSVLVPDAAFGLVPWRRRRLTLRTKSQVSVLARSDGESTGLHSSVGFGTATGDWSLQSSEAFTVGFVSRVLRRKLRWLGPLRSPVRRRLYKFRSVCLAGAAARQVSSTDILVTDRLHAAITALLVGTDVIIVDSLDQKSRHLVDTWLPGDSVCLAASAQEALDLAVTRSGPGPREH
jgi:exopolysaccharide biosynthesis predicted pyruvyltransferase EpsI